MRAVRITAHGGPDALTVQDIPTPRRTPGTVLVHVRAATVNPVDLANLAGKVTSAVHRPATPLPRTAGRDYAGVVTDGPDHLRGLEVWGTSGGLAVTHDGAQADYLLVPEDTVRPKPASLTFAQAAAAGLTHTVAWLALADRLNLHAGETLLVTGASGAVARAATDIAHWRGATVIAADRRLADDLTADVTIDTTTHDLTRAVLRATDGTGVDAVLDTVGGPLLNPALTTLRPGGRAAVIASALSPTATVDVLDFYRNERTLHGVNTLDLPLAKAADVLDILRRGFDTGALTPPRTTTFPLDQASAAYQAVIDGTPGTKIVLTT
ncbi:zinc-binding alcohol dehydrogenase family protein [Streptomyces thermoalcalitolerans]|uniref:Zinc-binding alcohol dehydrogenase family protein n=1 Tax=Streptomyces thermoalcalitolerans TaxID=65605 RepID=A0ABP3ZKM6_9ACTN